MKSITFQVSLDFKETQTFEELGLEDEELDEEVIAGAIEDYLSSLYAADCFEYVEKATINQQTSN